MDNKVNEDRRCHHCRGFYYRSESFSPDERLCADCYRKRAAHWETVCLPLYRHTDVQRLPAEAVSLIERWEPALDGRGIGIVGDTGRCKTRTAYCLLRKAHAAIKSVAAITSSRLARLSSEIHDANDRISATAKQESKAIREAHFLLIDDLGKEKFTVAREEHLYELLEHRTSRLRPTIWTSNASAKDLAAMMSEDRGGPIIRRLVEFSNIIRL